MGALNSLRVDTNWRGFWKEALEQSDYEMRTRIGFARNRSIRMANIFRGGVRPGTQERTPLVGRTRGGTASDLLGSAWACEACETM
jgi:hypothetical protein